MKCEIKENKVVSNDKEIYENGWYGKLKDEIIELDFVEAALLIERGKIDVGMNFENFMHFCSENEKKFITKYLVYKDLKERGLPVRTGFRGCDFRVYERGANASKKNSVKWVIFSSAEDSPCEIEQLGHAIKIAKNIRAIALWAVVDNDESITYYIISEITP